MPFLYWCSLGVEPLSSTVFVLLQMIFFNSPLDRRAPSADRHETLPRDRHLADFYNASPKIRGSSLKKFGGQKHTKFGVILHNFRL